MQGSRSSSRGKPAADASVSAVFAGALGAVRGTWFPEHPPAIAVALSGGLDSMVLLRLAHAWAREQGLALWAFHVHHGLSPNAGTWRAHCAQACAARDIPFDAREVSIDKGKSGVEAAARKARYAALGEMAHAHGVDLLLTAHHLDDQAETVLLQLLRGSGPAGLSGMDAANRAPSLLGDERLVMARPLLSVTRTALEALAAEEGMTAGIDWVEDESNSDPRFARNALRHLVMPALAQAFPGFQQRVARSSMHAQSALRVLLEVAEQDLAACLDGEAVDLARLRGLSPDRVNNLLRHWFSVRGLAMPSTAWMDEMIGQLMEARADAQLLVVHPDCHVRRHRDHLYLVPKLPELAGMRDPDDEGIIEKYAEEFVWRGESALDFPDYGGVLHFDVAEQGVSPDWLRTQRLAIDFRKGGERLKLAANRPSRSLKAHFQASGIPAWERTRLPVVTAGRDLLYAAGLGMDCRNVTEGPDRIALRWVATKAE